MSETTWRPGLVPSSFLAISSFPVAELKNISSIPLPPVWRNLSIPVVCVLETGGNGETTFGLGGGRATRTGFLFGGLETDDEHEPMLD